MRVENRNVRRLSFIYTKPIYSTKKTTSFLLTVYLDFLMGDRMELFFSSERRSLRLLTRL